MLWLIPIAGLFLGVYFGQLLDFEIPAGMVKYLSIGIMAALDSVFGGVRALCERKFDSLLMLSGFFTNALLAAALAYIGDMLGIDLYYAAVFAFGVRLFSNLSLIRVYMIEYLREKERVFRAHRLEFGPQDSEAEEDSYSDRVYERNAYRDMEYEDMRNDENDLE